MIHCPVSLFLSVNSNEGLMQSLLYIGRKRRTCTALTPHYFCSDLHGCRWYNCRTGTAKQLHEDRATTVRYSHAELTLD